MCNKVRFCFPKIITDEANATREIFPTAPVPGTRLTADGQRWCGVYTPASFFMTLKRASKNPGSVTMEDTQSLFDLDFGTWPSDQMCRDCPCAAPE